MSRYGLSGHQDNKTENYEPRRYSARAYRCVAPSPPLFFSRSPDGIDDGVLLRDVEGTLHVSDTARKGTGELVGYARRSCPLASISLLCITYPRCSLTMLANQKYLLENSLYTILSLETIRTTLTGCRPDVGKNRQKDSVCVMIIVIIHLLWYPYDLLRFFVRSGPVLSTLPAAPFEIQSEQYHTSGSGGLRLTHGR
jgi:hypothetical protein